MLTGLLFICLGLLAWRWTWKSVNRARAAEMQELRELLDEYIHLLQEIEETLKEMDGIAG
jgi:hypothetical protein